MASPGEVRGQFATVGVHQKMIAQTNTFSKLALAA
ncbi:hypothetical protein BH11MYX2_BH11MYX2_04890 [soil metagenome]